MNPIRSRPRLLLLAAVLVAAAVAGRPGARGQQPAAKSPPGKPADPVLVVVAMAEYSKHDKLKFSVPNALAFARQFAKQGYRVTFVTDKNSVRAATDDLGNAAEAVVGINDGAKLDEMLRAWLKDKFLDQAAPAPLGLIAFVGHAEDRTTDDRSGTYFLAADDTSGEGGVRVQGIQKECHGKNLPVVMLVDTCRTVVNSTRPKTPPPSGASEAARMAAEARGNRLGFSEERSTPLTVWATQTGKGVADRKRDMTTILAAGLAQVTKDGVKTFEARGKVAPVPSGSAPVERTTDLSLNTWLLYGASETTRDDIGQSLQIDTGGIDARMIFASTDRGRQAKLLPLASKRIELLGGWTVGAGNLTGRLTERGLEVDRPAGVNDTRFVTGLLNKGYDTRGKHLVFECTALNPSGAAGKTLPVLFQPSTDGGEYFYSGWNQPWAVPYNRPAVVSLRLDRTHGNQPLTKVSFSDTVDPGTWPAGSTLLVTSMALCDDDLLKQVDKDKVGTAAPPQPVNLLSRWWIADVLPDINSEVKLVARFAAGAGAKPGLLLEGTGTKAGTRYGRGGAVFPKLFVDPAADEVVVQYTGAGAKAPTAFTLGLYSKTKVLAEELVPVAAGQAVQTWKVKLKEPDLLDYIAVTTTAPEFQTRVVGLVIREKAAK